MRHLWPNSPCQFSPDWKSQPIQTGRRGRPQHGRDCSNASSGTMSRTCRDARLRGGILAKGRAESSRLDEASGGRRRAGASQCGRRRRASGRRHAGSGFASRVVRVLRGGRCDVGDRTAVPATSLAVADRSIHPRVVKKLEWLEIAQLRILHRLPFRMGFSDLETAPTISRFTKSRLQGNLRCFGRACSPVSPEQ